MATPHSDQFGNSCRLHINLADLNGNNLFSGKDDFQKSSNDFVGSFSATPTFCHFLGGWIKHTPDLMPFLRSYHQFLQSLLRLVVSAIQT